jgi:DNA end-binding protein Ku
MLALAMVFDGADRKTAAETCGMDRRTLRDWVHRYPAEYFDDIQDVKVTKDMLDLARHIVNQKAGSFEPEKFEDQYETALVDLINQKRAGKPIVAKDRPKGENVVDLMEALRRSVSGEKPTEAAAGQKEMLMPIGGKKPAKEAAANKPAAGARRKSA